MDALQLTITIVFSFAGAFIPIYVILGYLIRKKRRAIRSASGELREPPQTATRIQKQIDLTPKQILGLDIATQLNELPTHHPTRLTVAPAYVRTQFDKLSNASWLNSPRSILVPEPAHLASEGVSPWDVEHGPNPVIFSHLTASLAAGPSGAGLSRDVDDNQDGDPGSGVPATASQETGRPSHQLEGLVATLKRIIGPQWTRSSVVSKEDFEMSDFSRSEITVASSPSTVADDVSQTLTPATTTSCFSQVDKGKSPAIEPMGNVEVASYTAIIPDPSHHSSLVIPDSNASAVAESASSPIPSLLDHTSNTDTNPFACFKCSDRFRTPGQLKNHDNRKHTLRYKCPLCDSAFGLRNDLERHKVTRHTKDFPQDPTKILRCPNNACPSPEKVYLRKDNFRRHVKHCEKTKGKGKAKEKNYVCSE